jgi:hypothetical protein
VTPNIRTQFLPSPWILTHAGVVLCMVCLSQIAKLLEHIPERAHRQVLTTNAGGGAIPVTPAGPSAAAAGGSTAVTPAAASALATGGSSQEHMQGCSSIALLRWNARPSWSFCLQDAPSMVCHACHSVGSHRVADLLLVTHITGASVTPLTGGGHPPGSRAAVLAQFGTVPGGGEQELVKLVARGVAFHHSGLPARLPAGYSSASLRSAAMGDCNILRSQ